MKRREIFCASQASTAICLSMEPASSCPSSSTIKLGGRALDRHNPIIRDSTRSARSALSAPCASHLPPINPKPYHQLHNQNTNKVSSSNPRDQRTKISSKTSDQKKKNPNDHLINNSHLQAADIIRKIWGKQDDLISTTPVSSRYLLSDTAYLDGLSDYDPVFSLVPVAQKKKTQAVNDQDHESSVSKPVSSPSRPKCPSSDQVVVLRVSLHCKACEGKLRKHLSRMEGVTSFNIDFAAKKVTIMGDVTPLGVLESVSKVKNAQFWPAAISSTAAADGSTNVEINN